MSKEIVRQFGGVHEGEIVDGKYRVDRALGVGGTGSVFAAHHLQLDAPVAIKFLRPSLLIDPQAAASFTREARAATQMNNEHVARVFDIGKLATGAPYLVMEFLDGVDLGTLSQRRGGPLMVEDAVDFVLQACEALAEAHALGIVHRDLKPANLFCVTRPHGRPVIKVLDFGVSHTSGSALPPSDSAFHTPLLAGTPLYMSPEQIQGTQTVDPRADIWAVGVILCELLTGRTPFWGDTIQEISINIVAGGPDSLPNFMPQIHPGLVNVVETCLKKDRQDRYGNVAELAVALLPYGPRRCRVSVERIADILQHRVPLLTLEPAPPESAWVATPTGAPTPPVKTRRLSRGIVATALGVVGLGAALVAFTMMTARPIIAVAPSIPDGALAPRSPAAPPPATAKLDTFAFGGAVPRPLAVTPDESPRPKIPGPSAMVVGKRSSVGVARKATEPARRLPGWPLSKAAVAAVPGSTGSSPSSSALALASTSASGSAPKSDCSVTFTLDAQGRKHFKRECLSVKPTTASAAGSTVSNCDPTFELDSLGRKHFKPECFLN